MTRPRFRTFAWLALAANIAVILWGAYVRATGSGAGCGRHWPLCDGVVLPRAKSVELLVEFTHRASSGFVLLLAMLMAWWAFRAYPRGHRVRFGAQLALFFVLMEALLGAALVKFQLVAHNSTPGRAFAISAHLCNTFLLLAALALTAWWASGGRPIRLRGQGALGWAVGFALVAAVLLGMTGAITALGDTLFPAKSVLHGIRQDVAPAAHFLVRLRLLHPLIALSVGLYIVLIGGLLAHLRPSPHTRRFGRLLGSLFGLQLVLGLVNVLLLAPVWMQMVHLLVADLVWVSLVLLSASALARGVARVEIGTPPAPISPRPEEPALASASGWRGYVALTKPRVISLLLFTTLTAMFIAADDRHRVSWPLFLAVAIGGYMAAGAANAINMVIDRDIDARMQRTASRPTVTQQIPSSHALAFAFALEAASFLLLSAAANVLSAMLALAGLVFYVIVYTLALKRRTWHNIVIGGAAGAFPPLVGWAAVTGELSVLAWYLFAIIFVWTPVHFWALAILIKDDYEAAGIPMLPVVLGERATVIQIGLYAILTAVISMMPFLQRQVGVVYLAAAALLNASLLLRSLQLYRRPDRPHAKSLFKYSMVYLALLFLIMAVDRTIRL